MASETRIESNCAMFKDVALVEPTRESGVYALLVQLATLEPNLFPFAIVDYDTHSGIDVIAKMQGPKPIGLSDLFYVELKFFFEAPMNHTFDNMRYVVCWDTAVKHGGKVTDLPDKSEYSTLQRLIKHLEIILAIFSAEISSKTLKYLFSRIIFVKRLSWTSVHAPGNQLAH